MRRFHRPGAMAFLDMLEVGVAPLSFSESRAHFGLWVIMAQPLHVGMDIRNASQAYVTRCPLLQGSSSEGTR